MICIFVVVNVDALAQASIFSNQKETICLPLLNARSQPDVRNLISADRMPAEKNDCAIEDQYENFNSIALPYDQPAFSPLDPTAGWLSHMALAIYMFVVVYFDALAQVCANFHTIRTYIHTYIHAFCC